MSPGESSMRLDVVPVERDAILALRVRVLSLGDVRIAALSRDMSPQSRHWAALLDGEPVGCVSVMKVRGFALRGMGVLPASRRQGVGSRMLEVVCSEVGAMWCNARLDAQSFYAQRDWVAHGPPFEMAELGLHQRMSWDPGGRRGRG